MPVGHAWQALDDSLLPTVSVSTRALPEGQEQSLPLRPVVVPPHDTQAELSEYAAAPVDKQLVHVLPMHVPVESCRCQWSMVIKKDDKEIVVRMVICT